MLRASTILPVLLAAIYCVPARGQAPGSGSVHRTPECHRVPGGHLRSFDIWNGSQCHSRKDRSGDGRGCAGVPIIGYGDIVAVSGQPAKGTYTNRGVSVCMSPTPRPAVDAISDTTWPSIRDETYEMLQRDGTTPVGTIMTYGLSSGMPSPPGPPAGSRNSVITGGTGAFFGVRGQRAQDTGLSLFATGVGPTRASLTPGQPFPSSPLAVVNSPIDVTVNGKSAEVLAAVGYPGRCR